MVKTVSKNAPGAIIVNRDLVVVPDTPKVRCGLCNGVIPQWRQIRFYSIICNAKKDCNRIEFCCTAHQREFCKNPYYPLSAFKWCYVLKHVIRICFDFRIGLLFWLNTGELLYWDLPVFKNGM